MLRLHKEKKAQASFEMLLITAFVLTASLLALSQWIGIQDTTYAVLLAKTSLIETLHESPTPLILNKIASSVDSSGSVLTLTIYTTPSLSGFSALRTKIQNELPSQITAKTKFTSVSFVFP